MAGTELRPSAVFDAIGYRFEVVTEPRLAAVIDDAFGSLAVAAPAEHRYVLCGGPDGVDWTVTCDGRPIGQPASPAAIYGRLCWHVNQTSIGACDDRLLLHSAGATHPDGTSVLLAGPSGSGKSTLVAGLVRSGFAYLSDEAVGVDVETGWLLAHPRPIALAPSVWAVVPEARPDDDDAVRRFVGAEWPVAPGRLGRTGTGGPAELVVAPRYVTGAELRQEQLSPAETLVLLAESAFNLRLFGDRGFQCLAALARSCAGVRLTYGRLDDAVHAVGSMVGQPT